MCFVKPWQLGIGAFKGAWLLVRVCCVVSTASSSFSGAQHGDTGAKCACKALITQHGAWAPTRCRCRCHYRFRCSGSRQGTVGLLQTGEHKKSTPCHVLLADSSLLYLGRSYRSCKSQSGLDPLSAGSGLHLPYMHTLLPCMNSAVSGPSE